MRKHWIVSGEQTGMRLVAFLSEKFNGIYSSKKLKQALERSACFLNGQPERFASTRLKPRDRIDFELNALEIPSSSLQFEKTRVLYEDESLLFYDKPAGITSDTELKLFFPSYFLVHRLDRDTTGVILFAKTPHVWESLYESFKQQKVDKTYLALVDGCVSKDEGVIENILGRLSERNEEPIWGPVPKHKGKFARTLWRCLQKSSKASLLECSPQTGRTHQIRVHCAGMGHPILGDTRYCQRFRCKEPAFRCMLHAQALALRHPISGELIRITASTPEDFNQLLERVLK